MYEDDLVAGGSFTSPANRIAWWDGTTWHPFGAGLDDTVYALTVYQGYLVAGGRFRSSGGTWNHYVARWNGTTWGDDDLGFLDNTVFALTVFNGQLIVGGNFDEDWYNYVWYVARWDPYHVPHNWVPLRNGTNYPVFALMPYKGDLIVGGDFTDVISRVSYHWARWGLPDSQIIQSDLNHDCAFDWFDLEWLADRWLDHDCLYTGWCREADLNYDRKVDFADFAELQRYRLTSNTAGDFNNDGKVDAADLDMLALYWLQSNPQIDIAPSGGDDIVNFLDYAEFTPNWLEGN